MVALQDIASIDHPQQMPIAVDNRVGTVSAADEVGSRRAHSGIGGQGLDMGGHDVHNARPGKGIDAVMAADAKAAPPQLLGHQAVLVDGRVDEVGHDTCEHERKDHLVVAGDLEDEHDCGERRLGRSAERCGHRDDCEGAERHVRSGQHRI